jgi:hypothetical protein
MAAWTVGSVTRCSDDTPAISLCASATTGVRPQVRKTATCRYEGGGGGEGSDRSGEGAVAHGAQQPKRAFEHVVCGLGVLEHAHAAVQQRRLLGLV